MANISGRCKRRADFSDNGVWVILNWLFFGSKVVSVGDGVGIHPNLYPINCWLNYISAVIYANYISEALPGGKQRERSIPQKWKKLL